jgi:hypothetical protein
VSSRIYGTSCATSTGVWQKWRFSAPQTHLWLIKVWFSASTFVVKIATFAKPETFMPYELRNTKCILNMKRSIVILLFSLNIISVEAQTIYPVEDVAKYFNSIGVNISPIKYEPPHLHSGDYIKSQDDSLYFENLKDLLQEVGFKYVRATIPIELMCGKSTHMQDSILVVKRLKELYDSFGIKTFWVINHYAVAPWNPLNTSTCHLDTVKMDNASYIDRVYFYTNLSTNQPFKLDYVYAVEGLNEPEEFIVNGCDTAQHVRDFYAQKWDEITYRTQVGLFNKVTSNNNYNHMKVLAPSIWKFYEGAVDSLTAQGPIQNYFQAGNLHPYPNVIQPTYSWDKLKYHPSFYVPLYLQTFYGGNPNYGNNLPKYVTETGYQSQVSLFDTTFSDIHEAAAAKYMSFLHFEFFKNGIEKVLFYKMIENGHNSKDDRYGLAKIDYTPKPMLNTLLNMSKILSDSSQINIPLHNIGFNINYFNPFIFNTKVYQQKDNQIIIAIWRQDVNSACYDTNNVILPVSPINFSINFSDSFQKAYLYDPVNSAFAFDSILNSNIINLSLSDRAILIKIVSDYAVGLSDKYTESTIDIYPNPAYNSINIKTKYGYNEFDAMQIIDSHGRQVQYNKSVVLPKEISIQDFIPGIYILRLITKNNDYITKKFIKIH